MPFPCILLSRYVAAYNDRDHPKTAFQVHASSRDSLLWRKKGSSQGQNGDILDQMVCHHKMFRDVQG